MTMAFSENSSTSQHLKTPSAKMSGDTRTLKCHVDVLLVVAAAAGRCCCWTLLLLLVVAAAGARSRLDLYNYCKVLASMCVVVVVVVSL